MKHGLSTPSEMAPSGDGFFKGIIDADFYWNDETLLDLERFPQVDEDI